MSFDLKNKVALVTGANRGIGRAIVASFINHGARKVYLGVRSLEKADPLVATFGGKVEPLEVNYGSPDSVSAAAIAASDVEVVVSNAGILKTVGPLETNVIESFEEELEVNVYGLLRMAKAFAPVLRANGGGAFVQLNSVASLSSFAAVSTYCASKAAAYSFTLSLREIFAKQGTALLSVHPGPIETDMAHSAGLLDCDPVDVVSEGIVSSLSSGDFLLFPDSVAKDFEKAYAPFFEAIIDSDENR